MINVHTLLVKITTPLKMKKLCCVGVGPYESSTTTATDRFHETPRWL